MKSLSQNLPLTIAVTVSVALHVALLAVRFTAPEAFKFKPADPGLEVILVNAKHDKKPLKAQALAQANLDGGGNADAGRASSPLPDLHKTEDGESAKAAKRRIVELEEQQRKLLDQMKKKSAVTIPHVAETVKPREMPQLDGADLLDSARMIARQEAEINRRIQDENSRPRKTRISPSTQEVGYAMYYDGVKRRIENIGTLNFPQKDGKKLYGELVISIPIFQDGSIYEKEGGPQVEHSSGNPVLDEAAKRIVRRAAPFARFPKNMRSTDKDDIWIVYTRFKFTREEALETELRAN
ncbi:TonB C-terminal domain-containing protein [Noviherbaspirillum sedimenti]|uniref:Energy transducer TonB n=1 Tax=Noviherbaspirillum sedimenti TaxID=2320865 RepID=A0A3A3G833_9BURK|nr:energy transducer TonB [Noviherbaspirillum sedimenti]